MKQINDPVFGDLVYDESKKAWTKRIHLGIWFGDSYQLDLDVKCEENEEITDVQRDAYKSYLADLQNIRKVFPEDLLLYFKEHYEEFNRNLPLPDELNIDVVNKVETLSYFKPKKLFIDRKGNYGWLSTFLSPQYFYTVVLSDGKPRIFKGWTILKSDYSVVDDDVFGEMYFDQGWRKWIKTDINGIDGEWLLLHVDEYYPKEIDSKQKANYQKYLAKEKSFIEEVPHLLLKFYLENYQAIEEIWDIPKVFDKDNIDLKSIKMLVQFQKLFFHGDGVRYGWLCRCLWDKYDGLSLFYDEGYDGICIGGREDLII